MPKRKTDIRPPSSRKLDDLEVLALEAKGESPVLPPKVKKNKNKKATSKTKAETKPEKPEKRDRAMYYCDSKHLMKLKIHAAIQGKSMSAMMKDIMEAYLEENADLLKDALG